MAGIGRLDIDLGLNAAEYTAGLSRAEQQAAKFGRQIEGSIAALKKQVENLGFSERQIKIYELAQKGATREQLLSVNALYRQKEAFEAAGKATAVAAAAAAKQKASSDAIDKQVKALHDQVAVQGRSERAAKRYALEQAGATKEQLRSADAALRQKAAYESTVRFMGDLKVAALAAGAALAAAAVGAAVLFEKLVGKAAKFQDLAEKTGASAEALASFQVAAQVTETSMDTLANLSVKLTKGLAGTDEETKQAANAIKQLGIDVEDFRKLDPAKQFEVIGKALNGFADGAGKTAFAVAAMGRSGADALPFLKELGAQGQRNVALTAAQIKAADDYKDAQARLRAEIELYATRLAVTALPAVQDFQKALFETAKQILGVSDEAAKLAGNNDVAEFADKGARSLAVLVDGADLVVRGFQLAGNAIGSIAAQATALFERNLAGIRQIREESAAAAREIIDRPTFSSNLEAARARRLADIDTEPGGSTARPRPSLDPRRFGRGGGASGADKAATEAARIAKKQLADQLSTLDNFIKAEERLLDSRNNNLERLYGQDQLSIAEYFQGRAAALDRATFEQADIYNEQIALLEKFYQDTKEQTAKLDALKEIGKVKEKRSGLLDKSSQQATRDFDDSARAASDYANQVAELQTRLLELQGTEEAAARAALNRFDAQNQALLNRARLEPGGSGTEAAIGQLRAQEEAQARINALMREASVIEQNLATAQAKLHLERDLGMRDEIDSFKLLAQSSTEAAAQLQVIADRYLAIARADGSAVLIANAEAFQQKITELAAATDLLAASFRQTFVDTGASAIESFLNNLAEGRNALDSFKDAFKQFANDIIRQINRIAAQKIADSLFKSSSGGGDGGIFGGLADAFVQYIGGLGGREKGGPVAGRAAYVVGERGPELFVPQTVAAQASKQIDSLIAQRGKPAEYNGKKVAAIAANLPHMIGAKGPEIFVPKTAGVVIPNDKVTKLATVLEKKARPQLATVLEKTVSKQSNLVIDKKNSTSRRETILRDRRETILRDEKIIKRYANGPSQRDKYLQQSARAIARNQRAVADLVADAPRQKRAAGGQVTASTPYLVGELGPELFMPKQAAQVVKNERAIDALISNTTQRKNVNQFNNTNEVQQKSISLFTDTNTTQRKDVNQFENNLTKTIKAVSINKAIIANNSNKATNSNAITNINKAINSSAAISSKAIKAINNSAISNQAVHNQAIHNKAITNNSAINKAIYSNEAINNNKAINESTNKAITNSAINNINEAISNKAISNAAISNRAISSQVTKAIKNSAISNQEISNRAINNNATNSAVTNNKAINAAISSKAINSAISNKTISNQAINSSAVNSINKAIHNNEAITRAINESTSSAISNQAISNKAIDNSAIRNINKEVHEAIFNKAIHNNTNNQFDGATATQRKTINLLQTTNENDLTKTINKAVSINKAINNNSAITKAIYSNEAVNKAISESTNSAVNNNAITSVNNAISNKSVHNKGTIDRLISNIERTTNNVERTTNQSKLLVSGIGTTRALNNIINVHALPAVNKITNIQGGALLATPSEKVVNNNRKISELLTKQQNEKAVINNLKNVEKTTSELLRPIVDGAITIPAEKITNNSRISELVTRHQNEKAVINNLKSSEKKTSELLRPIVYGASKVTVPAERIINNSEIHERLISQQKEKATNQPNLFVTKAGTAQALKTLINQSAITIAVPAPEKIFNNNSSKFRELISKQRSDKEVFNNLRNVENTTSELLRPIVDGASKITVTNNSKISELLIRQRNEKAVINNLKNVEKTTAELWKPIVGSASTITVPTEKIINNKISELLTKQQNEKAVINNLKNVERTFVDTASAEKIINNSNVSKLISNQQNAKTVINNLKSVEKATELLRPAGKMVRNEQRMSEFVSNIQNNQTTNQAVQQRASGGPVAAYQYLIGDRGAEIFVPHDISVPSDFFTSDAYRRARGGMVNANQPYIVGERGPEWFVPKTAGQIVTNNKMGGTSIVVNQQFAPGTTRETVNQAAARAGQAVQMAQKRGIA